MNIVLFVKDAGKPFSSTTFVLSDTTATADQLISMLTASHKTFSAHL